MAKYQVKEYYLKKVGKTQDSQSHKLWQINIQNKKTKRAARTFFCFAENGSEANNKAKKALKMLGEGYELANAPHHIATKGDGQAEQYLKSGIKVIDKAPLSFMDSVVRAFKDKPFDDYTWLITYQTDFVGKKNFYSKKDTKEQAINELKNELMRQGAEKGLKIFSIKKNAAEILRRQAGKLGGALQKPKAKKWELYVYNKQDNRHIGIYYIEADTPKTAVEILKKGKRKIMNIEPKDWLIKVKKQVE